MKVTAVIAISLNGKITKGNESDVRKWTSKEDQKFFDHIRNKSKLNILGSGSFEVVYKNRKLDNKRLRIVMTRNPSKYKKFFKEDILEFTSLSPKKLLQRLEKRGYKKALLLGGAKIYASFIAENLVDDLFLTVEPKIFNSGKSIESSQFSQSNFQLITLKKLNERGTLLLHYKKLN